MSARAFALLPLFLLGGALLSQQEPPDAKKDDEEIKRAALQDPYTGGAAALMEAAGIAAYAPFAWADGKSTDSIDTVLGERRILWLETAHFRIGSSLSACLVPEAQDKRKALLDEIKLLRKKLPRVPDRPKRIDPWLRAHLYAQRLEALYADFQQLLGVTDADFPARGPEMGQGAYLGMPGKYLVLLFQKKSDLARYAERFCGTRNDSSLRWYHGTTHQLLAGVSAEGLEGFDETGIHGHVIYAATHNLLNGYRGFHYPLPLWLAEGLAHWYSRRVPSDVVNVRILDSEAVSQDKQADWPVKVRRRAQHEGLPIPFATMAKWGDFAEMGYHAHSQAWSRIDYLMQLDREKLGVVLQKLKGLQTTAAGTRPPPEVVTLAQKLLVDLYGLDGPTFDTKWRDWVLKTYPKK